MSTRRQTFPRLILLHGSALLMALLAIFFSLWFLALNPVLPRVFQFLAAPWQFGNGEFDWGALGWGIAAVGFFGVIGFFFLENFELYVPRPAALALALIFGMGLCGFVLELLAIPFWLTRPRVAAGLLALLIVLAAGAWRALSRPPQSGLGGEAGAAERQMRRQLARRAHEATIERPTSLPDRIFRSLAVALIAAITFFNFWHALLYTDVYWDSLILYLGYARMTYLEHGFPVKVVGQVGIGLGANYPHLYAVLGSGIATAMGDWSELPQRLIAPLCGVGSTVLVYHTALRLTRHMNAALAVTLVYRSIPLGIAYDQYASDYALAMLFAAAFLYLALRAIESGLTSYLAAAAILIGLSMHLNYLMGILWLPWLAAALCAQIGMSGGADTQAPWTALPRRLGLGGLMRSPRIWSALLLSGFLGSTWLVRNWLVTGNPVYAFFYKQFGGIHINPDVMEASAKEWLANGAGIGKLGETIQERILSLPVLLFGGPGWSGQYLLMPAAGAFALGGFLVWMATWLASPFAARTPEQKIAVRFGFVVALLFLSLIAFHVVLAPFYLYQIIKILPCLALFAALGWPVWRIRPWRWVLLGAVLWAGLVPGLAMTMMGFKIGGMIQTRGGQVSPLSLFVLRHPLPEPREFYRWRYGDEVKMWEHVNLNLKNQKLLTHENRHLVFDPSITLVHLDDWEMQALWEVPDPAERVRRLVRQHEIKYYLYVPNEDNTPTNRRMGARDWPALGLAKLVFETENPANRLYELTPR